MTNEQQLLSKKYLLYTFFSNLWFLGAVWLYFYRIFITDYQVGILDSMAFAIGLIAEVPSGALADRYGRDRMVKLGKVLAGLGFIIQALGSSFIPFFVGQTILMIGFSLVSGADEALFFDKLKFEKTSKHWRRLVTRRGQVGLIGTLSTTVIGAWLHTINPRIPWILTGLAIMISAFIIWTVAEDRAKRSRQKFMAGVKEYLVSIQAGFRHFRTPKLWMYVPIIVTVQGLFYTSGWGILRLILLDRFHFSPFWGSIVIATSGLITVGVLAFMHKYADNLSEKGVLTSFSLAAAASLLLAVADIGVWGYVVILILYAGEHVVYPFMSEVLNHRTASHQRATVLSVATFFRMLPYVALAPIIGYLNTHGRLEYFLITWPAIIVIAVVLYLVLQKNDIHVSMVD